MKSTMKQKGGTYFLKDGELQKSHIDASSPNTTSEDLENLTLSSSDTGADDEPDFMKDVPGWSTDVKDRTNKIKRITNRTKKGPYKDFTRPKQLGGKRKTQRRNKNNKKTRKHKQKSKSKGKAKKSRKTKA